jgi:hypothetical protein
MCNMLQDLTKQKKCEKEEIVSAVQMKSWAGKALETVNCFGFLKCKLTVVIRAC